MNNNLTIVSGFWKVVNKHDNKFDNWFSKTLKINCPYIFFGNEESINIVKKHRNSLPTHYINCEVSDFYTYKYIDCIERRPNTVNKKRKDIDRQIQTILDNYKSIESDKIIIQKYLLKQPELENMKKEYENVTKYIDNNNLIIIDMLEKDIFIIKDDETNYVLTQKGILATQLRETHCLVFANLFDSKVLDDLTSRQLVSIFSCFTNISVQDELKALFPKSDNKTVQNMVMKIKEMYDEYQQKEIMNQINTGADYSIHFDLLDYVIQWCDCNSIEECKFLLQTLEKEKGIFLGEFVKALLKINNISCELEKVSELSSNIQFLSKLREIPTMTLKYVVTNQSLYV